LVAACAIASVVDTEGSTDNFGDCLFWEISALTVDTSKEWFLRPFKAKHKRDLPTIAKNRQPKVLLARVKSKSSPVRQLIIKKKTNPTKPKKEKKKCALLFIL